MTPALRLWGVVAFASKTPVAMAPMALLFLGSAGPGGYALGAVAAAVYVLGEVAGAAVLGPRRWPMPLGLLIGAVAFAAAPFAPAPVLLGLVFVAGAAPATVPGGIRAMLTTLVPEGRVARAFSAEATLTQLVWAVAPGLAIALSRWVHPSAPLVLASVLLLVSAVCLRWLPAPEPVTAPITRSVWSDWPIYITSTAANALVAATEMVLPALLEGRGIAVAWAIPLFAWFALSCAAGAYYYGKRTWPGSLRTQGLVLLVGMACCLGLVVVLPGLPGVALGLLLAGLFQSGAMVSRSLTLRESLPAPTHAAAYSVMYAVGGIGYAASAGAAAAGLKFASPSVAIIGGVMITLVIVAVSWLAERRVVVKAT